jgi:hypothetical protein
LNETEDKGVWFWWITHTPSLVLHCWLFRGEGGANEGRGLRKLEKGIPRPTPTVRVPTTNVTTAPVSVWRLEPRWPLWHSSCMYMYYVLDIFPLR